MKRTIAILSGCLIAGTALASWPLYLRLSAEISGGAATLAAPTDAPVEMIGVEAWDIVGDSVTNLTVALLREYSPTVTNTVVVLDGSSGQAASNFTVRVFVDAGDTWLFTGPTNAAIRLQLLRWQ